MLKVISTDKAPAATGPYSQAMVFGNLMISSGQIPIDPATGEIAGTTIEEQAEQVMKNIEAVLEEAGAKFTDVMKTTCFLADMGDSQHLMKFTANTSQANRLVLVLL